MTLKPHKKILPVVWGFFLLPLVAVYSLFRPIVIEQRTSTAPMSAKLAVSMRANLNSSIAGSNNHLSQEAAPANLSEETPASNLREQSYTVRAGDTLVRVFSQNGATSEEAQAAVDAFADSGVPATSLKKGEALSFFLNPAGRIVQFRKKLGQGREIQLDSDPTIGFRATLYSPEITERERVVGGVISSCFAEAASQAKVPYSVVDELVDVLGARVEFRRDLQPGDTYSIVYTERITSKGELLEPGPVKAASLVNEGKFIAAVRSVDKEGKAIYFDESGQIYGNFFLRYPLQFSRISSVFSGARFHPVLGIKRPHNGVDFAAPTGTPVRAVADGRVEQAGANGGSGIMIKIRHDSRYETAYLHLSRIDSGVRTGSMVKRGEVIGAVGMTGLATGPHLHFSLYDRGTYVDPLHAKLPSISPNGVKISPIVLASAIDQMKQEHEKASALAMTSSTKVRG